MIIFKLDTSDATQDQLAFYISTELRFAGGFDDGLDALIDQFRSFAKALGYNAASVDSIDITLEEENDTENFTPKR